MTNYHGKHCQLSLRPPRIPAKSKKIYRNIFIRSMKQFSHLYHLDGLYIVSVPQPIDARVWIDKNYERIKTLTWDGVANPLNKYEQQSLF